MQNTCKFNKHGIPVRNTPKLSKRAEEIIFELEFLPGSIRKLSLDELINAFAVVESERQDILYVKGETPAKVCDQITSACEQVRQVYDIFGHKIKSLNVIFYFNHIYSKCLIKEIEQTYTHMLQEAIAPLGVRICQAYYSANSSLKLYYSCALVINYEEKSA